jgi:hypothetical protein
MVRTNQLAARLLALRKPRKWKNLYTFYMVAISYCPTAAMLHTLFCVANFPTYYFQLRFATHKNGSVAAL